MDWKGFKKIPENVQKDLKLVLKVFVTGTKSFQNINSKVKTKPEDFEDKITYKKKNWTYFHQNFF